MCLTFLLHLTITVTGLHLLQQVKNEHARYYDMQRNIKTHGSESRGQGGSTL